MNKRTKLAERKLPNYTRGEEIFNMVTHIVGAAFGVVMLVLGIVFAAVRGHVAGVLTAIVFGLSLIVLYTMSAVYHGLSPRIKGKKVMQVLDHCSVFLLIAGSYTPLTICALVPANPVLGWTIFALVWIVSIIGIILNSIDIKKYQAFSMICYLGLGWCIVVSFPVLVSVLPAIAIWLLLLGGIAYTLGAILFGLGCKIKYMHSIFHIFCVLGSILQAIMILIYVL